MPKYDYRCLACGRIYEATHGMNAPSPGGVRLLFLYPGPASYFATPGQFDQVR